MGMDTTATMVYGSVETMAHRVEHLLRLRELQAEALSGGDGSGKFRAFIPWSYQPLGTALQREGAFRGERASGFDYLRTVAVSRLLLDNIEHIQASWVTQGVGIAQVSLRFGVDDFGSTMMEENVVREAGAAFSACVEEIERSIIAAGFEPAVRDPTYAIVDRGGAGIPARRPSGTAGPPPARSAGGLPRSSP